ncbi:MAG: hypothetical protein V7735_19825 [Photobacterium frigidiphilum]|uniref:hypothetical protein n=1 Tax=Photobacterium frigidiphilum TaxID=264736 RepID=UPI003003687D
MDLLLILTYTALCIAVFKIFKIPLNKWTVPTAVLVALRFIPIALSMSLYMRKVLIRMKSWQNYLYLDY